MIKYAKNALGPSTRSKREKGNFPMQQASILSSLEMHRVFNMRIKRVYVFPADDADK